MNKLLLVSLLVFSINAFSQDTKAPQPVIPAPPTPVELMLGNNRANLLMIMNRPIDSRKKFSFFNVTVGAADYKNNAAETDMVINNALLYNLGKHFNASMGLQWNYKVGLVPSVGIQYSKATPDYLIVIFPSYNFLPSAGVETVAITEIKPKLSNKTRLYTRVQGLYVQNIKLGVHAKSAFSLRAGLTYGKFSFGIGTNFDYYGPQKIEKANTGVFTQIKL
jgi:hypothetical protein